MWNRRRNLITDNINLGPDYIKLIFTKRGSKPFIINIDQNKSLLELKKEIASKFNSTYTGFNLLNNLDIIDHTKDFCSIKECGIKRVVRISDNYNPGFCKKILFLKGNLNQSLKNRYSEKRNRNIEI